MGDEELTETMGDMDMQQNYDETVKINYAANEHGQLKKVQVLIDPKQNVLFVGEGNFTFAIAFAAKRNDKKWEHTWASCLGDELPNFESAKTRTIVSAVVNTEHQGTSLEDLRDVVRAVNRVKAPADDKWISEVNATDLSNVEIPDAWVWFQCPWCDDRGVGKLIQKTLQSAAAKGIARVFIGITKQFPYVKWYGLQSTLGLFDGHDVPEVEGFNFVGADPDFCKTILQCGYEHEGRSKIHGKIYRDHLTLCFEIKATA